ncbi:MAG TPA: hypothetical protein EYP34_06830 [Chromatiaceae bacterium]|nr:hypothetical protein [Chromatiaceae bacterium]
MFKFIPVTENNIFAVRVTGKLTDEDYRQFLPELEKLIEDCGPISLMLELENFQGWEPKAAWEDFRFGKEHDKDFARIAIVGRKSWQKWMAAMGDAFTQTKVRFFYRDALQEAWDWLREGNDQQVSSAEAVTEPVVEIPQPYRHILVALDFSPNARHALARALELARAHGAVLSLVHAVESTFYLDVGYDPFMVDSGEFIELDQQIHDRAEAQMKKLSDSLDYPNIRHEVLWGTPKNAVISYAEAQQVDLIVVGSHGRHGIARLLGSTAAAIAHSARCDVFVVRLPR